MLLYKEHCRDLWAALVVSLQLEVQGCSAPLEASIKNVQCKISAKEVRVCACVFVFASDVRYNRRTKWNEIWIVLLGIGVNKCEVLGNWGHQQKQFLIDFQDTCTSSARDLNLSSCSTIYHSYHS